MEEPIFGQDLWNKKDLDSPPVTTYLVCTRIETHEFRERFQEAVDFFDGQKQLEMETAFLSTSIFRMKQKFRSDKGFKSMQKLNKALRNYSDQNILGLVENFHGLLPRTAKPGNHLPTKNMLDFILVKLQGIVKLLSRIIETAKVGAHLMEERIAIGHLWRLSFVMYSIMSRIAFIAEKILEFSCDFYQNILPMRDIIGNVNSEWLDNSYRFPSDLRGWLNMDSSPDEQSEKNCSFPPLFEILDDSDVEFLDNEIEAVPEEAPSKSAFEMLLEGEDDFMLPECQPEEASPAEKLPRKKNNRRKRKKLKESAGDISSVSVVDSIGTLAALKKFVAKEAEMREKDRKISVFGHLDGLQWNIVRNCVGKFLKKALKDSSDQDMVDDYLGKAREVLMANLEK